MAQPEQQSQPTSGVRQVAVIPIRSKGDAWELCLIRRIGSADWGIPKGYIDPGYSPEEAALEEAFEEAGVKGEIIGESLGTYLYEKGTRSLTVAVYVMRVSEEMEQWGEQSFRERRWSSLEEASLLLASRPIQILWDRVKERLTLASDAA